MPKRFVSWVAVSSLPQTKKISLEDQSKTNQRHIEKWDGVLVRELSVPGESRSIVTWEDACTRIDAYAQLRDLIARREFDVLIYLDRSRLGRKASLSMTIVELCNEAGIITYATESPPASLEPPERNFHNKVVGALESVLAQEEVTKIQHRHEMGMAARVRKGEFPSKIPYGWDVRYEVDGERPTQIIEISEAAKAVIVEIYDLYLNGGASVRTIRENLRQSGTPPPRGDAWTDSAISVILNLAWRYAGYVELNMRSKKRPYIRAKSRWPALIDEATAKAVVAERKRRQGVKRSVDRGVHRFSHVVWCRRCERRMIAHYSIRTSRKDATNKRRIENFRCTVAGVPSHPKYQITGWYLDEAVRRAIEWIQVESNRARLLDAQTDLSPHILHQIERAKQRLAKHEDAVQRADDAYVMGAMTAERYQRQVGILEQQRAKLVEGVARLEEELEAEQIDARRGERLLAVAREGVHWLESDDIPAANAWFRRHIRIWIDNDNPEKRIVVDYV